MTLAAEWEQIMTGQPAKQIKGPPSDVYLVELGFNCNGVCNTEATSAMEEIIGQKVFDGIVRMNSNQLCKLLLALREGPSNGPAWRESGIRQYVIKSVTPDTSGVIDVSKG